jgi:hypothetical protein
MTAFSVYGRCDTKDTKKCRMGTKVSAHSEHVKPVGPRTARPDRKTDGQIHKPWPIEGLVYKTVRLPIPTPAPPAGARRYQLI